jgi:predicted ribosome quality control (RQC) complex YloA/Tae2 family protein
VSLNCVEIEKITATLKANTIIKCIYHTGKNSIVIETYDKSAYYKILIDTTDRYNCICRIPDNEPLIKNNLRFGQYLNSQFAGAKIVNISQYDRSRIVIIEIEKNGVMFNLVCRLWGTASNILLVGNDNYIIDTLKRLPKMNEWPQEEFVLPDTKSGPVKYEVRKEFDTDDINSSVFHFFKEMQDKENFEKSYKRVKSFINKELETLKNQLIKVKMNSDAGNAGIYLEKGELLKANLYRIKRGEKKAYVTDFNTGSDVEIDISPELTPSENVERYFNKYKKMKDGISRWTELKDGLNDKIGRYEQVLEHLDDIDSPEKLDEIYSKINSGKLFKISSNKIDDRERMPARKFILSNNYIAYVSKSAKDADKMLTQLAVGNDYWFHIRDYAGSHVIVKEIKNAQIPDEVKIEASTLALYFSKGRNSDEGDIYFTRVKYLHKGKKSPAGLVIPTQEKNIKVIFDKKILEKIFSRIKE